MLHVVVFMRELQMVNSSNMSAIILNRIISKNLNLNDPKYFKLICQQMFQSQIQKNISNKNVKAVANTFQNVSNY